MISNKKDLMTFSEFMQHAKACEKAINRETGMPELVAKQGAVKVAHGVRSLYFNPLPTEAIDGNCWNWEPKTINLSDNGLTWHEFSTLLFHCPSQIRIYEESLTSDRDILVVILGSYTDCLTYMDQEMFIDVFNNTPSNIADILASNPKLATIEFIDKIMPTYCEMTFDEKMMLIKTDIKYLKWIVELVKIECGYTNYEEKLTQLWKATKPYLDNVTNQSDIMYIQDSIKLYKDNSHVTNFSDCSFSRQHQSTDHTDLDAENAINLALKRYTISREHNISTKYTGYDMNQTVEPETMDMIARKITTEDFAVRFAAAFPCHWRRIPVRFLTERVANAMRYSDLDNDTYNCFYKYIVTL